MIHCFYPPSPPMADHIFYVLEHPMTSSNLCVGCFLSQHISYHVGLVGQKDIPLFAPLLSCAKDWRNFGSRWVLSKRQKRVPCQVEKPSEESKLCWWRAWLLPGSFSRSMYFPKSHWTLEWRGLHLRRGSGPQNSHFWGVRILRVVFFYECKDISWTG